VAVVVLVVASRVAVVEVVVARTADVVVVWRDCAAGGDPVFEQADNANAEAKARQLPATGILECCACSSVPTSC
jgi:hypothetical protein